MASSSKRHDAGVDGPIYKWTSFKESKGRVALYVSEVFSKAACRDHESAGDVFDDYETCIKLLIKLMEESSRLTVQLYDEDYLYNYAVQIKAKMLSSFSTMFSAKPPHLLEWEKWVFNLLDHWLEEEKDVPKVLLSESEDSIKRLDRNVKMMDDDLQININELKEDTLQYLQNFHLDFHRTLSQFRAYLDARKEEFKLDPNAMMDENVEMEIADQTKIFLLLLNIPYQRVKCIISRTDVEMDSLTELAGSCNSTLGTVEETISMLNADFCKLLRRSEEDLAKKWLKETHYMEQHPLVRREKGKYEKARADSDVCWEQIKYSSGLLH